MADIDLSRIIAALSGSQDSQQSQLAREAAAYRTQQSAVPFGGRQPGATTNSLMAIGSIPWFYSQLIGDLAQKAAPSQRPINWLERAGIGVDAKGIPYWK